MLLRFIPEVCFYDWSKDLESNLPKVPKKVQKGSKNLIFELETSDSYQKSVIMIDEKIWSQNCPKCILLCPKGSKRVQKRVQKGSKNYKNLIFELGTWDSYQKSVIMIEERIWSQNCPKCILMCPKRVQKRSKKGPKRVQKSNFWDRDLNWPW